MDALLEQVGTVVGGILDSAPVRLFTSAAVAYIILLWLATAYWVLQDMRRRHRDPAVPYLAAAAVVVASPILFPLAVVVYRIVRPGETMAEARERELTERLEALEDELELSCPGCSRTVEEEWLVCPACRTRLAHQCVGCGRSMGLDWAVCGWCATEFGQPVIPERLPKAARPAWAAKVRRSGGEPEKRASASAGRRASQPGARALEPGARALEPGA